MGILFCVISKLQHEDDEVGYVVSALVGRHPAITTDFSAGIQNLA